ncbi:hypothetical protein J2X85_002524 [Microbacterium trichothecenolyticum]|jgi:hypothetical protein|uniref:hypothetical protein n=1 Tax=Microbacterium trichothecenolyticum TaxID=69370 RepID=UPI002861450C|nr:hypothetical protein [Microbacterium trichothecenolyticum]MDR7185490.1 hypothetical protein [Microbacterium trichothecenolyticum]
MTGNRSQFELRTVAPGEWLIIDTRYQPRHADSTVARIWEVDSNQCEVAWTRDLARPTRYATPNDALAELHTTPQRTKPVPIPHLAPHRADNRRLAGA